MCHEICFARDGYSEADKNAGLLHARAVIVSGADDAAALATAAFAISLLSKDHATAVNAIERAVSLNASCATAQYFGGLVHAFTGNPGAAISHANRALRLSPFDPFIYQAYLALGLAAVQETRYDEAASHFAKAVQANPRFSIPLFYHSASLVLAGRADEARPMARRLLELEPSWRARTLFELGMVSALADKLAEAARLLGLPE